jgi:hypothetical protein
MQITVTTSGIYFRGRARDLMPFLQGLNRRYYFLLQAINANLH